jgi:hypothetical protein
MRNQLSRSLRIGGAEIEDGRLSMEAAGETTLRLQTPRCQPLSKTESVCTLTLGGDGWSASADLTDRDVDALINRLEAIRDGEVWHDE